MGLGTILGVYVNTCSTCYRNDINFYISLIQVVPDRVNKLMALHFVPKSRVICRVAPQSTILVFALQGLSVYQLFLNILVFINPDFVCQICFSMTLQFLTHYIMIPYRHWWWMGRSRLW